MMNCYRRIWLAYFSVSSIFLLMTESRRLLPYSLIILLQAIIMLSRFLQTGKINAMETCQKDARSYIVETQ